MENNGHKLKTFIGKLGMIDIRGIFEPTERVTKGLRDVEKQSIWDSSISRDRFYLKGLEDYGQGKIFQASNELIKGVTDSAIAEGVYRDTNYTTRSGKVGTAEYWLRDNFDQNFNYSVKTDGKVDYIHSVEDNSLGIDASMRVNLQDFYALQKMYPNFGKFDVVKDSNGNVLYHTVKLGFLPQTRVKSSPMYDALLKYHQVKPTGKNYTGFMRRDLSYGYDAEYKYQGERFVRKEVNVLNQPLGNSYNDDTLVTYRDFVWLKVEPIEFIVLNWDEVQSGKAAYMDICSEKVLKGGMPFNPNHRAKNSTVYHNSLPYAYLEGVNNFAHVGGFARDAFVFSSELLKTKEEVLALDEKQQ